MKRNRANPKHEQKIIWLLDAIQRHAGHMKHWMYYLSDKEVDAYMQDMNNMVARLNGLLGSRDVESEGEDGKK